MPLKNDTRYTILCIFLNVNFSRRRFKRNLRLESCICSYFKKLHTLYKKWGRRPFLCLKHQRHRSVLPAGKMKIEMILPCPVQFHRWREPVFWDVRELFEAEQLRRHLDVVVVLLIVFGPLFPVGRRLMNRGATRSRHFSVLLVTGKSYFNFS